jgi:hypothetical protein
MQKGGPDQSGRSGAARREAGQLFLLLALGVGLLRMIVSCLGFLSRLGRLLLCARVIATAVLLRRGTMSFRSLLVMFSSLLVRVLGHDVSLLFEGGLGQRWKLPMVPAGGR